MAHERGQIAFRNKSVSQANFAMVPRPDVPRSVFKVDFAHKSTFNAGRIVPVYLEEVLPGDSFNVRMTGFARMATPLFPVMDNFHMDSFFFFVPNRLVWDKWVRMMGERPNPTDSIDFTVPQIVLDSIPTPGSIYDYMGIPTVGQVTTQTLSVNALPLRAYQLIFNEWFRDENILTRLTEWPLGDGPDTISTMIGPLQRGKRYDYFTSCLPWPQKGDAVTLPLGTSAPVVSTDTMPLIYTTDIGTQAGVGVNSNAITTATLSDGQMKWGATTGLETDLTAATAATINAIRTAFQVQKLLERDARGGTRYVETLLAHFGVQPQDARLQRPEYLGGGSSPIQVSPIAQTSATGLTGGTSPLGALGGVGTGVAQHGFSGSFPEHGFVLGLVNIRADLTYQQGLHRLWSRETRYDYYWPVFAHLGEQAVLRKEIYVTGDPANDDVVFGYQERWSEYRYHPSQISGLFRSTASGNIDEWHAAQHFTSAPTLGTAFIQELVPMSRILAGGVLTDKMEFLFDSVFQCRYTRAMPTHSVPGFIDRF